MGGVCESGCNRYINDSATISIYNRCNIPEPYPLNIRIVRKEGKLDTTYDVFIGRDNTFINFKVIDSGDGIVTSSNIPQGVIVTVESPLPNRSVIAYVELRSLDLFPSNWYTPTDEYHIYVLDRRCLIASASAQYVRGTSYQVKYDLTQNTTLNFNSEYIIHSEDVPRITINTQTTIDGSDIGDTVFTIYDEFTYYNINKIPDNTCKDRQTDNVKTTIFRECCPYMVSVIKGEGKTLWDKLQYLFNTEITGLPNVYVFYRNIALYGMAKYILSRLLFGDFNINYLLGKYYDKFIAKLSKSRFCKFITYFQENISYEQYFLYTN